MWICEPQRQLLGDIYADGARQCDQALLAIAVYDQAIVAIDLFSEVAKRNPALFGNFVQPMPDQRLESDADRIGL